MKKIVFFIFCFCSSTCFVLGQSNNGSAEFRKEVSLNSSWATVVLDELPKQEEAFVKDPKVDSKWQQVNVPHNWDQYYGFRRTKHGNLHGTAWYQKR
jgi:hypothetical protein